MQVKAKLNYLRIAPRKVRLVADLVRGKSIQEAQTILKFTRKKGSDPLIKLLKSAVANAKNNFHLEEAGLFVAKITVDEGPKFKRFMPRARGQAYEIQKKTSHINLVLETKEKAKKIKKAAPKAEEQEIIKTEASVQEAKIVKPEKTQKTRGRFLGQKPKKVGGFKRIFRRKSF